MPLSQIITYYSTKPVTNWWYVFNPLSPTNDPERISLYTINMISSRQVMRIKNKKHQLGDYLLIQFQILQTNFMWIVWETVRRITNEILGVKGLTLFLVLTWSFWLFVSFSFTLTGLCDFFSSDIFNFFTLCWKVHSVYWHL